MPELPDDEINISTTFGGKSYSFKVKRKDARFVREAGRIIGRYIEEDRKRSLLKHDVQDALSYLAIIYISKYLELSSSTDLQDLETQLKGITDDLENYNSSN